MTTWDVFFFLGPSIQLEWCPFQYLPCRLKKNGKCFWKVDILSWKKELKSLTNKENKNKKELLTSRCCKNVFFLLEIHNYNVALFAIYHASRLQFSNGKMVKWPSGHLDLYDTRRFFLNLPIMALTNSPFAALVGQNINWKAIRVLIRTDTLTAQFDFLTRFQVVHKDFHNVLWFLSSPVCLTCACAQSILLTSRCIKLSFFETHKSVRWYTFTVYVIRTDFGA